MKCSNLPIDVITSKLGYPDLLDAPQSIRRTTIKILCLVL